MASVRPYDITLLGANGYTGALTAEHITSHMPTNLRWAVAGRSASKLQTLLDELRKLNPDRVLPDVLPVQLTPRELDDLVKKTTVLLNCVGPYHLYSTPVVEACVNNRTHYLDVTGETTWVREIIQKFHQKAVSNSTILIPEIGVESAPSDLVAYTAVTHLREPNSASSSAPASSLMVTCAIHDFKAVGPSGGSLATALGVFDNFSSSDIRAALDPYCLSPAPPSNPPPFAKSLSARVFGPFTFPGLGILTSSVTASADEAIVHRSAGLLPSIYGSRFHFREFLRVQSFLMGVAIHFGLLTLTVLFNLGPFRWLLRKLVYQPGQGPSAEANAKGVLEYRAVAVRGSEGSGRESKATARLRYEGSLYYLTGVFLAEAAMVLLREPDLVKELGGGVLTPACLGDKFVERLQAVGVQISGERVQE